MSARRRRSIVFQAAFLMLRPRLGGAMVEQFRQPEKEFEARRVGNGLPTKYFCWLRRASKLPALRLNAGAMDRQPT